MKPSVLLLTITLAALSAQPVFARGAPAGAGGPPSGVTLGPPANGHGKADAANPEVPSKPMDANDEALGKAANVLGKLNAAHANANALAHANSNSAVGAVAAYQQSMRVALDPANAGQRASLINTAQLQLASTTNKTLTPTAITRINALLGLNTGS